VVALLLMTSRFAAGQELQAGVRAGIVVATLSVDDEVDAPFDNRVGLAAGGFLDLPIGDRLSVQPEVLFVQKGATFDDTAATGRIELDMLDVPVLARYRLGRLFVLAGPSISVKLRARQVLDFGEEEESVDIGDDVESFDVGIVGGIGYESGRLSVDGRLNWGLRNVNAVDDANVKTRSFMVLVGYRF
jgi:hypothetical protein